MEKIFDEDTINELNGIYGIENCKWEILDYIRYLKISKENHFVNYNIMINNDSDYPFETKIRLIEFLYKRLKNNNIITTDYEFITQNQLKAFKKEDDDDFELDETKKKKEKKDLKLKKDLIIIDSEKISFNSYTDEIIEMMEKNNDKVYILINKCYFFRDDIGVFNKYFDWYFKIDEISKENKINYATNILYENKINISNKCNYINELSEEQFIIVKSKMNRLILNCKLNGINEVNNKVIQKYLKNTVELKKNQKESEKDLNFDSLIGSEDIKGKIDKIVNYLKICKNRESKLPTLHMCFTGNPGTGKTTVARMIGQIFEKEKILSNGTFVEVHGRDLVGKYVGWTAKEVKKIVEKAKGGVLFIDEAYSLNSNDSGSFADEAIATLIKEMEDNRDDLCVILAGYQDEMAGLIKRNPGFESRIQFYIDFPNYNEDELYQIFKGLAQKEKYKLSSQVKEILLEDFRNKRTSKSFSNGRYVRNIYEKVKIEQANRVTSNAKENINLIKKCDVEDVLVEQKPVEVHKIKIGFAV